MSEEQRWSILRLQEAHDDLRAELDVTGRVWVYVGGSQFRIARDGTIQR